MSRKKNNDFIRTLTKVARGRSYSITLPISIVRELNWQSSQQVCVRKWGNKILIQEHDEHLGEDEPC